MESKPPSKDRLAQQIDALAVRFGAPVRELIHIPQVNRSLGPAGFPLSSRRTAEVVLVIPRPGRKVLVHTKNFYPSGVWRLPTGGLHRGERIDDAIRREAREETGNDLLPCRFLFHLRFRWEGAPKQFDSYGFLTTEPSVRIESRDPREQITAFRDVGRDEFEALTRTLEGMMGSWFSWGRFRAAPHRFLLQLWPDEGGPGDRKSNGGETPPSP
jgi:8-oxo-dGTP pyrophosphatase MutT (NUDIX family)